MFSRAYRVATAILYRHPPVRLDLRLSAVRRHSLMFMSTRIQQPLTHDINTDNNNNDNISAHNIPDSPMPLDHKNTQSSLGVDADQDDPDAGDLDAQDLLRASLSECRAEASWIRFSRIQQQDLTLLNGLSNADLLRTLYVVGEYGEKNTRTADRVKLISAHIRTRTVTQTEFTQLVTNLSKFHYFDEVSACLDEMRSLRMDIETQTFSNMCYHLIIDGKVEAALKMYRSLETERGKQEAQSLLSSFLRGFAVIGDFDSAVSFAKAKQQSLPLTEKDYYYIIKVSMRAKKPEKAMEWLDEQVANGFEITQQVINTFIHGYSAVADVENAYKWFRRSKHAEDSDRPDIWACNVMLWCYVRALQLDKVSQLFHEMRTLGPQPELVTCNLLMEAFVKSQDIASAYAVLKTMKNNKFRLNVYTYTIIINGFCKAHRMDVASDLIEEMRANDIAPNNVSYNTMIHGHSMAGDFEQSLYIYRTMKEAGMKIDSYTLTTLMHGAAITKQLDLAMELFDEIKLKKLPLSPVTYSVLLFIQARRKDMAAADEIMKEITRRTVEYSQDDVTVFNAYLYVCMQCRNLEATQGVLRDMKQRNIHPNTGTYTMLMELASVEGKVENVLKMFNILIKDESLKHVDECVVTTVIRLLGKHGHLESVKQAFDALTTGNENSRIKVGAKTWFMYIRTMIAGGNVEEAKSAYYNLFTRAHFPIKQQFVGAILQVFKKNRLMDELQEMVDYLDNNHRHLLSDSSDNDKVREDGQSDDDNSGDDTKAEVSPYFSRAFSNEDVVDTGDSVIK